MEYRVTGNIKHSGRTYTEGDTLDLPQKQAAPLIVAGVLESPDAPQERPMETKQPKAKKERKNTNEPEVGGEKVESGEPSMDGPEPESRAEAEDVTPEVVTDPVIDPSVGL